jgi:hypothetical protein
MKTIYITNQEFIPMNLSSQKIDEAERNFRKSIDALEEMRKLELVQGDKVLKQKRDKAIFGPKLARWK